MFLFSFLFLLMNTKQLSFTAFEDEDSKKDDGISFSLQSGPAWAGSERDYTYDEVVFKSLFSTLMCKGRAEPYAHVLFLT